MNRLFTIIICLALSYGALAQTNVSGTVVDETGQPLPGVTVLEKGTANGAITDIDGKYTVSVGEDATLVFSFIGYRTVEVAVNGRSVVDYAMELDIQSLNEVVVTAFGLEKEEKSLGFATTVVDGDELIEAKDVGFMSQLAGKVAGLDITRPTTGPAGSTSITIRGLGLLSGDNRPLIVVDGVPVNNSNFGSAGMWGGIDQGDGLSSFNQDDIASINVMKGSAAGVLYGERGAAGVVVITTKRGKAQDGVTIEYNGNLTIDEAAIYPDFYQREYGQGQEGVRPSSQDEAVEMWESWGEKFDGEQMVYFDGVSRPYSARPEDDILNYYKAGYTLNNSIAISGGSDKMTSRLSFSNLQHEGIVPNSGYDRNTFNLLSSLKVADRLKLEMKANYSIENAQNRINLSDNPSNPGKAFSKLPMNISVDMLRNNLRDPNNLDNETNALPWSSDAFTLNPYWGPYEHVQEDEKRRLIGYALANYEFTDWLSLQFRYAVDWSQIDYLYVEQEGTEHNLLGSLNQVNREVNDNTIDFILNVNRDVTSDINVDVNLGGTQNYRSAFIYSTSGSDFGTSGLININNMLNRNPGGYSISEVQTNALFANALISYKNMVFLDGSIRNDWYSTLTNPLFPDDSENSALYGGANLSFVFSDAFQMPEFMTFGKLRASYGTSGNGTRSPYQLLVTYALQGIQYNGQYGSTSVGNIGTDTYPSDNLSPTITNSLEVGVDLRFLSNRVGLDFTYYKQNTKDQIFSASLPAPTSYNSYLVNAGDVENKGIEMVLNGTPIQKGDLTWDLSLNITSNRNTVLDLVEGIDNLSGESARFSANLLSEVGGQVRSIYGNVLMRDENGNIVHDAEGLPIIEDENKVLGNYAPDWYGGLTSTLRYKDFSLSFIIDTKQGGEIYSLTNAFAYWYGMHPETLVGRENPLFEIQGQGVNEAGEPNTAFASLDDYYAQFGNAASENIFDASYIKLRQLTIGYNLPAQLLSNTPFKTARVSLTGRNLFFLHNGLAKLGLDPEAVYNTGGSGFEYSTIPSTRSYGININFQL